MEKANQNPADPAHVLWHPGIMRRKPVNRELTEYPTSNEHRAETEQKDKKTYLEEQLSIEVQGGSVYIYSVMNFEGRLEFSACEKKSKDGRVQTLEHYAYVSFDRLSNSDITSRLRGVSVEHMVLEGIKLIRELREENYKDSNGRMIYINENKEIKASHSSIGCPIITPKYLDSDGEIIHADYQRH